MKRSDGSLCVLGEVVEERRLESVPNPFHDAQMDFEDLLGGEEHPADLSDRGEASYLLGKSIAEEVEIKFWPHLLDRVKQPDRELVFVWIGCQGTFSEEATKVGQVASTAERAAVVDHHCRLRIAATKASS